MLQNVAMCQPQTSLRSDIAGERMPRTLLPVADSADFFKAERLAFALGEPSRKNADGEKLPGVSPVARHNTNGRVSVSVTKKRREGVCVFESVLFLCVRNGVLFLKSRIFGKGTDALY